MDRVYAINQDLWREHMALETKTDKDSKTVVAGTAKTPREAIMQDRERNPVIPVAAHLPTDIDEPFKVLDPDRPKPTPEQTERAKHKAELLAKVGKILASFDNRESSIPASNEYWHLIAELRASE